MCKVRLMLLLTMVMLHGFCWGQRPEMPGAQPFKVAFITDTGYDLLSLLLFGLTA